MKSATYRSRTRVRLSFAPKAAHRVAPKAALCVAPKAALRVAPKAALCVMLAVLLAAFPALSVVPVMGVTAPGSAQTVDAAPNKAFADQQAAQLSGHQAILPAGQGPATNLSSQQTTNLSSQQTTNLSSQDSATQLTDQNTQIQFDGGDTYTYNGFPKQPGISAVLLNGRTLSAANYSVVYGTNNTNAGVNTATVTVVGKNGYSGSCTRAFTILKRNIQGAVNVDFGGPFAYTGMPVKPSPTVTYNSSIQLVEGQDYVVDYQEDPTQPATYGVTIRTLDSSVNFTGYTSEAYYTVTARGLEGGSLAFAQSSASYTGQEIQPNVTVSVNGTQLTEGDNYTLRYVNQRTGRSMARPKDAGTYEVIATGKTPYEGTVSGTFTVLPASMADVSVELSPSSYPYDGTEKRPSVTAVFNGQELSSADYSVEYLNNISVGSAVANLTGQGNFASTTEAYFEITTVSLSDSGEMTLANPRVAYTGSPVNPGVTVKANGVVLSPDNYQVTYRDQASGQPVTAPVEPGTYAVIAKGLYPYTGQVGGLFAIVDSGAGGSGSGGEGSGGSGSGEGDGGSGSGAGGEGDGGSGGSGSGAGGESGSGGGNDGSGSGGSGSGSGGSGSAGATVAAKPMYRLYNPNSGEHFYTSGATERANLMNAGWSYEGLGWYAPQKSSTPVYRLYNPKEPLGDHHYTSNPDEVTMLIVAGWSYEGIGWYSDTNQSVPVYRQYNPNAYPSGMTGAHNYTTDRVESQGLVAAGWADEGVAWYGV